MNTAKIAALMAFLSAGLACTGIDLRGEDIDLALSEAHWDDEAVRIVRAADVCEHYAEWFESEGIRVEMKGRAEPMSRRTTDWYSVLRLSVGFLELGTDEQALTWVHEGVHARQWRHYGRGEYALRYALSDRFRWAMEVQATRAEMRWYATAQAEEARAMKYDWSDRMARSNVELRSEWAAGDILDKYQLGAWDEEPTYSLIVGPALQEFDRLVAQ